MVGRKTFNNDQIIGA